MANGEMAQDVIIGKANQLIKTLEDIQPPGVCSAHSDLCQGQAMTLRVLVHLCKKHEEKDNDPEIKTKWFTIHGAGAMYPAIIIAILFLMGFMFWKVHGIERTHDFGKDRITRAVDNK